MRPRPRTLAALLAAALSACASRTPPSSMPDDAPASPRVHAARPALVTRALDGDPPLPGEEGADAWTGLRGHGGADAGAAPDGGHAHEHHHHAAH